MNAHDGAGFAHLSIDDSGEAIARFRRALELFPDHARSLVGLGAALSADGQAVAADAAFARASTAIEALRRGGRGGEATLVEAFHHASRGKPEDAIAALHQLLEKAELSFAGWTIPVEPLLERLKGTPGLHAVLSKLAARAR
jgi:tetratricopeptide (TPR) repeat protein